MPKYICTCEYVIDLSGIPNPNELLFISDEEFDGFDETIISEHIYERFGSIIKCPNCNRLHVKWDSNGVYQTYKIE